MTAVNTITALGSGMSAIAPGPRRNITIGEATYVVPSAVADAFDISAIALKANFRTVEWLAARLARLDPEFSATSQPVAECAVDTHAALVAMGAA